MQPEEPPVAAGIDTFTRSKRQHQAFAIARLVLVLLFMALWVVLLPLGYPMPTGFLLILAAEALVLAAYRWRLAYVRVERTLDRLHYLLLALELFFHTAIVYFLGGLSWLGAIAYIYSLMYATVFLSWRQAVAFTAAVGVAFLTIISLDAAALVPHQWYLPQGPDRFRDLQFVVPTVVAFAGVLATVTFWMVFIGAEVRRDRDEALRANAELIAVQGQLRALNEELERKVEERTEALLKRAETDQLTGLLNRGAITRRFREMLALAQRGGRPLAVVLADGDNFKACNDVGGHPHGDRILQFLARGLTEKSRETDYIGRMGGDEFLLLLPDTTALGAVKLCRRVAEYIEKKKDRAWDRLPVPALSFGIAVFPTCGSDADILIRSADQAMYQAKREGGNCWRFSGGVTEEEESEVSGTTA
ncbi:MAG TPA: GGDEF domain-containing protein [Dehalococcoidia bacterium]|nr:GGDEF domain-containing protein [Dehalococcoidia bacterium]